MTTLLKNILLCFLAMVLFSSCRSSSTKTENNTDDYVEMTYPMAIDVYKEYEVKPFDLSEVSDIEYVLIETRDDVLLDGLRGLSVSDSLIVVYNGKETIFVFDRNGGLKTQFNRKGRGPSEYQSITSMVVDFEKNEIYVYDFFLRYKMLVYSISGDFKRSFSVRNPLWVQDFKDYNEEFLLAYTTLAPSAIEKHKGLFTPYYFINKKDGELKPVDIQVPKILDGTIADNTGSIAVPRSPLNKNGQEFFISDYACDTMYMLKNKVKEPYIVSNPSLQVENPSLHIDIVLKTMRYTFLKVARLRAEEMKIDIKILAIDHKTGEIFEPKFQKSSFNRAPENYFKNLLAEYSSISIPAFRLIEAYEKGELEGELKGVASKLKEDDNPVLMLIKFKK